MSEQWAEIYGTPCPLCGGSRGPDITDRPMCYGCGTLDMMPSEVLDAMPSDARHTRESGGGLFFYRPPPRATP